jgi:large subunit ribosomal protein L21
MATKQDSTKKSAPAKKAKPAAKKESPKSDNFFVISTGGKQYRVASGDVVRIEKLEGKKLGDKVVFENVLLSFDGNEAKIGTPLISGGKVEGEIIEEGRNKKITVIKYKQKSRYFKNRGHRQPFIKVKIN